METLLPENISPLIAPRGPACVCLCGIFFIVDIFLELEVEKFEKDFKSDLANVFHLYGLINNSSLSICLLKTVLSVVFMDDKSGCWENAIHSL